MSDEAKDIVLEYERVRGLRQAWFDEAHRDHAFRIGIQYEDWEVKKLKERAQAPIVLNRILPQVAFNVNMAIDFMPEPRVIPVGSSDANKRDLMQKLLKHVLYRSNYEAVLRAVATDQVTIGVGWFHVYVRRNPVTGAAEVFVDYAPWYRVVPDPESIRPDLSDAAYVFVANYISRRRAATMFPEYRDRIKSIPSSAESVPDDSSLASEENIRLWKAITDSSADTVLYLEQYYAEREKHYIVTSLIPEKPFTVVLDQEQFNRFRADYPEAIDREVTVAETRLPVVRRKVVLGYDVIEDDVLYTWYDDNLVYPLVPAWYEHLGNTEPVGLVRGLRGSQQEYNKLNMIVIAHATATAGVRLLAPKNSVDPDAVDVALSRPIGVIEYNPTLGPKGTIVPQPLAIQQLPAGVFALLSEMRRDMDYAGGVSQLAMGQPERAPRTSTATLAIEEWSRRRVRPVLFNLADAVKRMGRVVLRMIQTYYTSAQVVRIVNPEEPEKAEEIAINLPIYDEVKGTVVERFNDISANMFDIHVDVSGQRFSSKSVELQWLIQLYQMGLVDDTTVFQKLDIPNKDEIIKRKSLLAQLQQGIKELSEYVKQLERKNAVQENQLLMTQLRAKVTEMMARIQQQEMMRKVKAEREYSHVMDNLASLAEEMKAESKGKAGEE